VRELPEGWEWTSISEIGEVVTGSTPSTKQPEYFGTSLPFYKPTDLDAGYCVTQARQSLSELGESQCRVLPEMSILVTCIGATIGKSGLARKRCATNQQINAIVPHRNFINPSWLYWMMTSPDIQNEIISNSSSTTLPILNKSRFSLIEIPLPPLNEQKRIADRLDQLLTSIDKTKAHLDRIPPLLKRFRQSVLAAATSGKLSKDWREEEITREFDDEIDKVLSSKTLSNFHFALPEIPETWIWKTAIQCCEQVVDCHNKTAPYTIQGIKLIRTSNVRNGKIDLDNTKFIDQKTYEFWSRRCPPKPGDLIFTREAPMAEVGMIPDNEMICMGQRMMLLRCNNLNLLENYLLIVLQTSYIRVYSDEVAVGTGVKHLRVRDVENLPIPIPHPEEQQEIVRRVEALFAKADRIEAQYKNARQQVDRLTPALLAKAFRGELVPQDPNDEPASVLLGRVKEARSIGQVKTVQRTKKKIKF